MMHIHWWKCHNGANQAWYVDTKGNNYPKQPLGSGLKFQIKSGMTGNRAVFASSHIGSHQYLLRIQDNDPTNKNQWWSFDLRTNTIRAFYKKSYCIGNRLGYAFRNGQYVVSRPYKGLNQDKIKWFNGRFKNIRNNGGSCLDTYAGRNSNNMHLNFNACKNKISQSWNIDQIGGVYHKQPKSNGVKFQIRSKMPSGKALFYHERFDANRYRLRIQNNQPFNSRQWFTFDSRTKSIRSVNFRNFAVASNTNQKMQHNAIAIIQRWGTNKQKMY
jgi:hypothetical protein